MDQSQDLELEQTDKKTSEKTHSKTPAEDTIENVVKDNIEDAEESIFKSKAKIHSEGAVIDEESGKSNLPKTKETQEKESSQVWQVASGILVGSLIFL